METIQLLGSTLGIGFLAGIRLYATVLALGLAIRFGWLELSSGMAPLGVLADDRVLIVSGTAFLLEFFADKIPWVDSVWDSLHTVIRPVGAGLLAFTALEAMDPAATTILSLLTGGVAFAGHSSKAATRLAANHSPEPFSNVFLSLAEDLMVPFGVWLAIEHPVLTFSFVALFMAFFAWVSPKLFRIVRIQLSALAALVRRFFRFGARRGPVSVLPYGGLNQVFDGYLQSAVEPLPARYLGALERRFPQSGSPPCIRCVATKGMRGFRNSIGYLCFLPDRFVFVTRRLFRDRLYSIETNAIQDVSFEKGILLDSLIVKTAAGNYAFDVFKPPMASAQDPVRARAGSQATSSS